jgi:polysaccharide export outer membrane protein
LVVETPPGPLDELRGLPEVDMETLKDERASYRIGPGDVLQIEGDTSFLTDLSGTPALRIDRAKVKLDGKIYLPVLGGIQAEGLTPVELQESIQALIRERRLKEEPFVTIDVVEYRSQRYYVVGEVGNAGAFPVDGQTTLLDAILRAGGVTAGGDLDRSYMLRDGAIVPVDLAGVVRRADLRQNIRLRHGDVVYVPSAENRHVYIFGEIARPGVLDMGRQKMTLVQAIAQAGGLNANTANRNDITIFRGSLHDPRCFRVSECEILSLGNGIGLHPGDRILVGPSEWATAKRALDLVTPFFDTMLDAVLLPYTIKGLSED